MRLLGCWLVIITLVFGASTSFAKAPDKCCNTRYIPKCDQKFCCNDMGGISYCDSSAGRYVCNNGFYSSCYCTIHAVMDIQKIEGCCLWQGGVFNVEEDTGLVVCNNGGVSEVCSIFAR